MTTKATLSDETAARLARVRRVMEAEREEVTELLNETLAHATTAKNPMAAFRLLQSAAKVEEAQTLELLDVWEARADHVHNDADFERFVSSLRESLLPDNLRATCPVVRAEAQLSAFSAKNLLRKMKLL